MSRIQIEDLEDLIGHRIEDVEQLGGAAILYMTDGCTLYVDDPAWYADDD